MERDALGLHRFSTRWVVLMACLGTVGFVANLSLLCRRGFHGDGWFNLVAAVAWTFWTFACWSCVVKRVRSRRHL